MKENKYHTYQNTLDGIERKAEVLLYPEGWKVVFYKNNVFHGARALYAYNEMYAEDCAENFVMGIHDGV